MSCAGGWRRSARHVQSLRASASLKKVGPSAWAGHGARSDAIHLALNYVVRARAAAACFSDRPRQTKVGFSTRKVCRSAGLAAV